ncbi:unnamed protein product [Leuciscus chuanchicus]
MNTEHTPPSLYPHSNITWGVSHKAVWTKGEALHPLRSAQTTVPLEVTGLVKKGQIIIVEKVPGKRKFLHEGMTRQLNKSQKVQIDSMNFAHVTGLQEENLNAFIHLLDSSYTPGGNRCSAVQAVYLLLSDSISKDLDNHSDGTLFAALAAWTSEVRVKHNAVDSLLKFLQSHGHPQLPSTAHTLLKTPREVKTVEKSGMECLHYQLKEKLVETLDRYPSSASMQFVFDSGVPIPQEEHTDEEDSYNRTLEERHTSREGADYNFYGSSTSGLKKGENGSEGLRPRGKS